MEQRELKDILILQDEIKKKAKASSSKTYMNIYQFWPEEIMHKKVDYRLTNSSLVFAYKDEGGIYRMFFISYNVSDLEKELSCFPQGAILDYICKGENELEGVFLGGGFRQIASYTRKSINFLTEGKDFKRSHSEILDAYYDETVGEYATENDAEEITELLNNVFDKEVDHIPFVNEVREYAKKKWILVYRLAGKIRSLYIFQIQGRKFYSNFSYNSLPATVLYCLEKRAHMEVVNNYNVIMKYSWINTNNDRSLKRNILKYDGVYTYIYKKV